MGIVLRGPGIYVPSQVLTNKDLVELVDGRTGNKVLNTSDEWIVQRSGIRERRISLDVDVKEMGVLAVRDLQERLGDLKVDEIRFATNRHRDGEFPCYAASIAGDLGLGEAIIHDGLAGCTGLIYSIRDAYNAILTGEVDSSLVIGSEKLTDFTNYEDRKTCVLFGDGAGAYKLERREGVEGIITNFLGGVPDLGSKEWPHGILTIRKSDGKKLKRNREDDGFVAFDVVDDYLIMNGREVFRFATKVMGEAVHKVLDGSGYGLRDVDVIIPHGANMRIIEAASKAFEKKGFGGKIYTNMEGFGNTSTASIPLAAAEAIEQGVIEEGSLVINVAFGAGFTYGANLYRASF